MPSNLKVFLEIGVPISTYITATSEANTYGITQNRWYDGKSEIGEIYRASFSDGTENWKYIYELTITKIDEVFNLHDTCSDDSYYQCLAKRFTRFNFKEATDIVVNGSKCSFNKLCAPFSLRFENADKTAICPTEIDQTCYGQIISQKLEPDQVNHCQKSCHVKEFSILLLGKTRMLSFGNENENGHELVIVLKFDPSLGSIIPWKSRALELFKTVKREYYIMSGLSFVGNIGGTLGMFVGFSFIGSAEWFMGSALCRWLKIKR